LDSQHAATKAEIVIVFVAVRAIIGFSYFTAHHAAANTPTDPVFRHLVRPESTKPLFKTEYLYVPLLFQVIAWVGRGCITLARQHPRVVAAKYSTLEEESSLFHPCVLFTYLGRDILELFKRPDEGGIGIGTCFTRSI
jgi:hypothetical protein